MRTTRLLLFSALLAACTGTLTSDGGESPLPTELRQRALDHLERMSHSGLAPTWAHADLAGAIPLYRKDVAGPAYYEVRVTSAGLPAGFMLLATGPHDAPIPSWSAEGESPTVRLQERALAAGRPAARFLRLDTEYAAEDASGAIAVTSLPAADPESAWRDLEVRAMDPDYQRAVRAAAQSGWNTSGRAVPLTTEISCGVPEAPVYNQLAPGDYGNSWSYFSGCGGTAWAMLIGWIDERASEGDPKWAPYGGLYRTGGAQDTTTYDAPAPFDFDWGARVMTDNIRRALGSIPWPGNNDASTDVYQMGHIGYFLAPLGEDQGLDWPTYHIGGAPYDGLKDNAISFLCNDHQPAILGIGLSSHYSVTTHYYRDTNGNQWFYENMGWGPDGPNVQDHIWEWPSVFLVGSLTPHSGATPTPPPANHNIEILTATIGSTTGPAFNNTAASMSAACNSRALCSYQVPYTVPGVGVLNGATPFHAEYRCGAGARRTIDLPSPSSGQTVSLRCLTVRPPTNF
jgi:hypothetical protein